MGGDGSTRWKGHQKKRTVEECLTLDSCMLARKLPFSAGYHAEGINVSWTQAETGELLGDGSLEIDILDPEDAGLIVSYDDPGTGRRRNMPVGLTTTRQTFGGLRWWFVCLLPVRGQPCQRRVRKVYLPPGGRFLGCRQCHDLTYRSRQESHRFDRGIYGVRSPVEELGLTTMARVPAGELWEGPRASYSAQGG